MAYLMGVDLGSTSIKAVIYDTAGNIAASAVRPTEVVHLDPDHPTWSFWDPDKVWSDTVAVIRESLGRLGEGPDALKGLAVTGLGMDGVPIDGNGNWLYPFISWLCPRTEPQSRIWSGAVGQKYIFDISGKQVLPIDTIYRLIWMQENKPEILARADKWLLIEDYVNFRLCGRRATDYTMASCTSVLDQKHRTWSEDLIAKAGVPLSLFPEVLPSGSRLGDVSDQASRETGLAPGTPVVLGGHDYICAALAVGAFQPGIMMDITGTWEIVLQSTLESAISDRIFDAGLIVEGHVARDRYVLAGYSPSALMMEWFNQNYGFEEQQLSQETGRSAWAYLMEKAAAAPCGANGAFFMPHFAGAGPPVGDNRALGAFVGLSTAADKGNMIRAMIEGLDYQFREIVEAMEGALEAKTEKIIAVGGASRNQFWMQNKADVTGKIIEVPGADEATTLGAALLAGIGVGIYENETDAFEKTYKPGKSFTPDPSLKGRYDRYYSLYREVYAGLKEVNHKIFDTFRA